MRKRLDPRIQVLINNNVETNHRSFIVLVGDKGRDQIVNLHFLLSQARVSARPSVVWCYKNDLGFTRFVFDPTALELMLIVPYSHRKKREAKIKRDVKRGIREANEQNPFEIFVTVTDIRYVYDPVYSTKFICSLILVGTIKNRTKYSEIRMGCASFKISRLSRRIYSLGRLKLWKEVDWSCYC